MRAGGRADAKRSEANGLRYYHTLRMKIDEILKTPSIIATAIFFTMLYALTLTVFLRELLKFKTLTLNPASEAAGTVTSTELGAMSHDSFIDCYLVSTATKHVCYA